MKVITARTQIRELPALLEKAWKRHDGTWKRIVQAEPDTQKIHAKVAALNPETATVAEVEAAMGFSGWLNETFCRECQHHVDVVVQLGEEPDYESRTTELCLDCLRSAVKAAEDATPKVICAWCPNFNPRDPANAEASHTICPACQAKMAAQAEGR